MSAVITSRRMTEIFESRLKALESEQTMHFVELRKLCSTMQKDIDQIKEDLSDCRKSVLSIENKLNASAGAPVRTRARKSVLDGLSL